MSKAPLKNRINQVVTSKTEPDSISPESLGGLLEEMVEGLTTVQEVSSTVASKPTTSDLNANDRLVAVRGPELIPVDLSAITAILDIKGIELAPIPPGPLPNIELGQVRKMLLIGPGTWTHSTLPGGSFTLAESEIGTAWFDGSGYSLRNRVMLPNTINLSDWSPKEYRFKTTNDQFVIHQSRIYKLAQNQNALPADVPGVSSKWEMKFGGYEQFAGDNILELVTPTGQILLYFNDSGEAWVRLMDNTVDISAIRDLQVRLDELYLRTLLSPQESDVAERLIQFVDSNDNELGYFNSKGELVVNRIKVNELEVSGSTPSEEPTEEYPLFEGRELVLPKYNFFRFEVIEFPWDFTNKTPIRTVGTLFDNSDKFVAKFIIDFAFQGGSSLGHRKRGYSVDLYNKDGQSVEIKFGDMISVDGFHLKAFWGDITHTRDVGAGRLWLEATQTLPFPLNLVRKLDDESTAPYNPRTSNVESANFSTDGMPFQMTTYGDFFGLFTWRLKKTRLNYAIDNRNPNHIFLDSQVTGVGIGGKVYSTYQSIITDYEQRSPRAQNTTQATQDNLLRFFGYMRKIFTGELMLSDTHQDYLIIEHWIDFLILGEFLHHWDSVTNNSMFISYDGIHFFPVLTDTDNTLGMNAENIPRRSSTSWAMDKDVFRMIRVQLIDRIRTRYTQLRRNGVLDIRNIKKIYGGIADKIPYFIYQKDVEKWGAWSEVRNPGKYPTMDGLYYFAGERLKFLDTQWLNS